jgi:ATP-dependent DNA helicase RecQ
MSAIDDTLKNIFQFEKFKSGQHQVIETILNGDSAVSIFPTGAGKSLCYQLPAILEEGMTLVVSPLLSLMKDQIDFLKSKRIPAAQIDSTLAPEDYHRAIESARGGKLKILIISVERFKNERFRTQLRLMNVSLLVVDEAHCISEWGHNFRPDYLKIPLYQKEFAIEKVLLLTATATPVVIDDMRRKFSIEQKNVVKTGFYRENLYLRVYPIAEEKKNKLLCDILTDKPHGPSIVYVTLQKTADRVAQMLEENGLYAESYHAGMKNEDRERVQNQFITGEVDYIVATIAFGMGIDKQNIRKVIHYDLPKSIESYSQEIGRSGRDGKPSLCCVLGNKNCISRLENFIYGDTPSYATIHKVLECISQSENNLFEFRSYSLSRLSDIKLLPLKTLLVYLEMANIILPKYTYFETYSFKYLISAENIVEKFKGERARLVQLIFDNSKTAKTWTKVDIDKIVKESGSDRQRVLTALEYFHENNWIELKSKSVVEVFKIIKPDFDIDITARDLVNLFSEKEKNDINRLHEMVELFEAEECLPKNLSKYFGEDLDSDCGSCSVCISKEPAKLLSSELSPLDQMDQQYYNGLVDQLKDKIETSLQVGQITKFLCGISSPVFTQYRVMKMYGFGKLEAYPYKDVEKWVQLNNQ